MLSITPRPTTAQAIDYVRNHFATHDYGADATVCGCVVSVEGYQARDVLFTMGGDPRPVRMTVWYEWDERAAGGYSLYGEW